MSGKIKFDEGKHAQLVTTLNDVSNSFSEVITALKNAKATVDSDFKGTAADALKTALQGKIDQLKKEKESWYTVIRNANQIQTALVDADMDSKKIIQGPSLPPNKTGTQPSKNNNPFLSGPTLPKSGSESAQKNPLGTNSWF